MIAFKQVIQKLNSGFLTHFSILLFRTKESIVHAVYFWFSFILLIIRTIALSLFAADIHDQSKKPIQVFRKVPTNSWCLEVQRFSDEVINNTIALSGMRFFYLTRRLILSVNTKMNLFNPKKRFFDFSNIFSLGGRSNNNICISFDSISHRRNTTFTMPSKLLIRKLWRKIISIVLYNLQKVKFLEK